MAKPVTRAEARGIRKALREGYSVRDVALRWKRSRSTVTNVQLDARTFRNPADARIKAKYQPGMTAKQLWVKLKRRIPIKQLYRCIRFRKVEKHAKKLPNTPITPAQLRALCALAARW